MVAIYKVTFSKPMLQSHLTSHNPKNEKENTTVLLRHKFKQTD